MRIIDVDKAIEQIEELEGKSGADLSRFKFFLAAQDTVESVPAQHDREKGRKQVSVQTDIFGNAVPVAETAKKAHTETIQERYRKMYGYDETRHCGDCRHVCGYHYNEDRFLKCNLIGISSSEETDIRLTDPACSRFEARS